jgi:hypothetical protein
MTFTFIRIESPAFLRGVMDPLPILSIDAGRLCKKESFRPRKARTLVGLGVVPVAAMTADSWMR